MTVVVAALLAAGLIGFIVGISVAPVQAMLMLRRRALPPQVIAGHVFPHPADERWTKDSEGYWNIPPLRVRGFSGNSLHGWANLWIGDVKISDDCRRYWCAINAANEAHVVAKALEQIPLSERP